jgi:molybdopterin/thiamine biosynthesis adenylyltransferase
VSASAVFVRYRYGAGFVDPGSGLRFEGHAPAERPDLWTAYLDGAEARYRHHGVGHVLDRPAIEDDATVSLFWIAFDGDDAVAGVRCHGPLQGADDAHALIELAGNEPLDDLHALITRRLDSGILEFKGGWVARGRADKTALSHTLARCFVHSMQWFGTRYGMCTVADQAIGRWSTSGGRAHEKLAPVAYPDDRYQTVLLWWDLEALGKLAHPSQLARLAAETAELWTSSSPAVRYVVDDVTAPDREAVPPSAWKPLLLDPSDPRDGAWIQALIDDPGVEVRDTLIDQIKELRELRPAPTLGLLAETPRWVHYNWRRSIVRVVGPASFRRIRLDRNRNKITADEQEQLAKLRVGVVGLSVGHVIAYTLALEGLCGELRLADFDTIELSNLNRIPGTTLDLGLNKAVLAARRIAELDPYLQVTVFADGISTANLDEFVTGLDVVVEECDSLDLKLLVREACRRHQIPVIMETSDRGMLDVERFDLEPDRPAFHGQLADLAATDLVGLSTHDKVPYVLRILDPDQLSGRMAASMAEIDHTVTTWPQLGGDVTLGAATVAAAIRRLGRGEPLPSGRLRIDLDGLLDELEAPAPVPVLDEPEPQSAPPPADLVGAVAHAANLAPSGGNVQPWRFEADERELRFYLARERTSGMDVHFRGSYVAIGAALFNAQIAAAMRARLGPVELFPSGDTSDHVATLHFGDTLDIPLAELYAAVLERTTNRKAGEPAPLDASIAALLGGAAESEGARLRLIADRDAIDECAELLAESDRLRYLTPRLHQEMMSELRWPGRDSLDTGIDVRTLELDRSDLAKLAVARRSDIMAYLASWNAGRALGDVTRERVRASSGLAMITVPGDDPASYVRGGAAVERVWLCAQQAGLAIQPVSPVFIFATEHDDFVQLVSDQFVEPLETLAATFRTVTGVPPAERFALFLRLTHAPDPSYRSARRALADALTRTEAALTSAR